MYRTLATSSPLQYGEDKLHKTVDSLKRLAKQKRLPLHDGHDGPQIGWVRNLQVKLVGGVHHLLGILDTPSQQSRGLSMQYDASRVGNSLDIRRAIHVALTDNPRDNMATFSDSGFELVRYSDSVDEASGGNQPETTPETTPTQDQTPAPVEIELTDEIVGSIFERALSNPEMVAKLIALMPKPEAPTEAPKPEPTRIIIKPVSPTVQMPPAPKPRPIQQPFRPAM